MRATDFQSDFNSWFNGSKIVDSMGEPLVVYHGTNADFDKFDSSKGTFNIIWFSDNREKIASGEAGAAGVNIIKEAYIKITNPAGWDEYESLMLDQIQQEGYDGVILDDDYIVFDSNQIWIVK